MATSRVCLIPDCGKPAKSLNLCGKHYQSSRHLGVRVRTQRGKHKRCTHPGCERPHYANAYCTKHHSQWIRASRHASHRKRSGLGELLSFVVLAGSATTKECIIWPGLRGKNTYLHIKLNGQRLVAHRLTCELMHGAPPDPSLLACHSCNRRNCINPHHLRWDTHAANMEDKILHGTVARGSKNGFATLTEAEARMAKYDFSKSIQQWADHFGVCRATISHIRNGRNWPHI